MQTILIGGQQRAFAVGVNQGDIYCRAQNITLAEYAAAFNDLSNLGLGAQRDLLFSALKAGAEKAGQPLDFTNLAVGEWMDAPEFSAADTLGVVLQEMGEQFARRQAYQAERAAKNAAAPDAGATMAASTTPA